MFSDKTAQLITNSISSVKEVENDAVLWRHALGMPGPYGCGRVYTAAEEQKAVAAIEIEEPAYDFRQVSQGEVVKHDFRVFNRGSAPLEIKSVKPG